MIHFKGKHRDAFHAEGRSLLDTGFSVARAHSVAVAAEAAPISSEANMETEESARIFGDATKKQQPPPRPNAEIHMPVDIAEI